MSHTAKSGPRLNPFAFASDTSLRFALLAAMVAAADVQRWFGITVSSSNLGARIQACMGGRPLLAPSLLDSATLAGPVGCLKLIAPPVLSHVGSGLVLLTAMTTVLYMLYPRFQARRLGLQRLDPADAPDLARALDLLCRTAGLDHPPAFWWNPLDEQRLAIAFGTRRQPSIALTGGMALLFYADLPAFRALLLHELAHVRNRDSPVTYLAMAIWWAFIGTALMPALVIEALTPETAADRLFLMANMLILAGGLLLIRNSVLRARELYADARSFSWQADQAAFSALLGLHKPTSRLRALLSTHPDPERRRRLLEETDELFRFSAGDAFGTGLGAGFLSFSLCAVSLIATLPFVSAGPGMPAWPGFVGLLLLAVAMAVTAGGALAIGTWRATFLGLFRDERIRTFRIASACAAGVVIGGPLLGVAAAALSTSGIGSATGLVQQSNSQATVLLWGAAACLVMAAALAGAFAGLVAWVEAIATAWLPVALSRRNPGTPLAIGLGLCMVFGIGLLFAVPFISATVLFALQAAQASGPVASVWFASVAAMQFPLSLVTLPSVVAIWAVPLSACLWTKAQGSGAAWAFAPGDAGHLPDVRLQPFRTVLIAAVCGAVAALVLTWVQLPLQAQTLHDAGLPTTPAFVRQVAQIMSGILCQGLVAFGAALSVARLRLAHGVLAAFACGLALAAGQIWRMWIEGWQQPLAALADIIVPPLMLGGCAAGLAGGAAAVITVRARGASSRFAEWRRNRPSVARAVVLADMVDD